MINSVCSSRRVLSTACVLAWVLLCLTSVYTTSRCFAEVEKLPSAEKVKVDSEKALKKINGNWFNSDTNTYRPPVLSKGLDDSIRQRGWLGKKKQPSPTNSRASSWSWGNLGINGEAFGWIVFASLGFVLLAGLIAIAYYYFGDSIPVFRRKLKKTESVKVDMAKVEDLPFEVQATNDDPLAYAESLKLAGRYNEAVVYLYGYMLLALDQSRKIHLQKGKTNRMYLRELRTELPLQGIVNKTMLAFEDVFFGRYDIDRARFEILWQQKDEFHRLLRPTAELTADGKAKVATV